MSLTVNLADAKDMVAHCIRAKLVPMVSGSPACGKSSIVQQLAAQYNLELIDVRLAQSDPTDLNGFPFPDKDTGKAGYMPMDTFPLESDPLPKGKAGWLLFLDEFNSADRGVQKAAYKLVLDRKVGKANIHEKCAIVCAGNLATDNAIVEDMSTALQSRLIHMEVDIDLSTWLEWAAKNGIDHRIMSFIKFKPSNLYTFSPDHTDKTYAAPRTWEFTSRLLKRLEVTDPLAIPMLAGTISLGVAREFIGFCRIYQDLPTIEKIIAQGKSLLVPSEPSTLFALTGAIAAYFKEDNAAPLMDFVVRMPKEFQVVCLREIVQRDRGAMAFPPIVEWIRFNGQEVF